MYSNIKFGADYYPEHWAPENLETDASLMEELGLDVVRMGEFAWQKMEPSKNNFNFSWLDEAIEVLAKHNIKTVLGTPTATPPAWIIEENPEILPVNKTGIRLSFGGRHHDCQSNLIYRDHIKRIVSKLANQYKNNKNVIGFQIDNELGNSHDNLCHCSSCRSAFQNWLNEKYKNIDNLNNAWGTVFWSQTYSKFSQIPTPVITPNGHSPSLLLDWNRFHSDLIVDFQKYQINIIRNIVPEKFITHNLMGFHDSINYFNLSNDLDFVSHDQYLTTHFSKTKTFENAGAVDLMRSLKKKSIWIMEQQAGPTGWEILSNTPKPNQLALWSMQSIARGADAVVFFRWRTCSFGTEEYWHGILPHSGIPNRRYVELKQHIEDIKLHMDKFKGMLPNSEIAILYSYEQNWAFKIQPHHPDLSYINHVKKLYKGFYDKNIPLDFINEFEDFSKYKILLAPLQFLMNTDLKNKLENYAKNGGVVVFTMRSGVKDMENKCYIEDSLPGLLRNMSGIKISDYDCLFEEENIIVYENKKYPVTLWADILIPITADVIAVYNSNYYRDCPAITKNKFGNGYVYYIGAEVNNDFIEAFYTKELNIIVPQAFATEENIEYSIREDKENKYVFVLNHGDTPKTVDMNEYTPIINSENLPPYGYALFHKKLY